ncbi:MAG TPA: hypothetical protein VKP88_01090, partial [Candidatus Paceibacterota bacterium]|nr:hypothetical protein [Candidatus Paceibacterota bacterium]
MQTISAAEERINALYTQRTRTIEELSDIQQELADNRETINKNERIGDVAATQRARDARQVYLEERDNLNERKLAIEQNIAAERN